MFFYGSRGSIKINKVKLGQFYTKKASYITQGLLNVFPENAEIIDPFSGKWDLLKLFSKKVYGYDIDPKNDKTVYRDSLNNPVNYNNKWIITNPPYLAKNKTKDKSIYQKYNTDDLYKASLLSIIGCRGGIIIVPLNFFSSDNGDIRKKFLSKYEVKKVNVFEETVFEDTTYTVCAFSFIQKENEKQKIDFIFFPSKERLSLDLLYSEAYTIGYEIYNSEKSDIKIGRLLLGQKSPNSKIFLNAIDTGTFEGMIRLSIKDHFYGKSTDRAFATIVFNKDFTIEEQEYIVKEFNIKINEYRKKYRSLFLTNYRNSTSTLARKRIGFKLAYTIISNIILDKNLTKNE